MRLISRETVPAQAGSRMVFKIKLAWRSSIFMEMNMRLVLEYTESDGCTYSFTTTLPVEFESAEALAVEFEEKMKKARQNNECDVTFAGHEFYCGAFFENGKYYPPAILTIDEWFATI